MDIRHILAFSFILLIRRSSCIQTTTKTIAKSEARVRHGYDQYFNTSNSITFNISSRNSASSSTDDSKLYQLPFVAAYTSHPKLGGECKLEDFEQLKDGEIESGSFSKIYKTVHIPSGKTFILKKLKEVAFQYPNFIRTEERFQHELDRDDIAKIYCTIQPSATQVYFVMDFFPRGDLIRVFNKEGMNCSKKRDIIKQLLQTIYFLHQRNIAHLDLKPGNILLDNNGKIKLTDFGFAQNDYTCRDATIVRGSDDYIAPEIEQRSRKVSFGRPADWYAAGATAYSLATGYLPVNIELQNDSNATSKKIPEEGFVWPSTKDSRLDQLLKILSLPNPDERWHHAYTNFDKIMQMEYFKVEETRLVNYIMAIIDIGVIGIGIFILYWYWSKHLKKTAMPIQSPPPV